jgi:hypothetical protein
LGKTTISNDVAEEAIDFIRNSQSRGVVVENSLRTFASPDSLSKNNDLLLKSFYDIC